MRVHTGNLFKCDQCPAALTSRYRLNRHIESMHNNILHHCTDCDKTFRSKDGLRVHMRCHSESPKFLCPYCAKVFAYKASLDGHIGTHTGERPYKCECGLAYTHPSSLSGHRNVCKLKQNPKTYHCDVCSKLFKHPRYLKEHKKIHEEPGYQCPHCGKMYHQRTPYRKHMMKHHPDSV